jgi:hypothetical protein
MMRVLLIPASAAFSPKAHRHRGRRLDIDDLAAPQGERQRDPTCAPSDVDYDIVGFDIRSDDRQVWIKWSERIGFHKRMVGGAANASISRRLQTAQARALREHGIDPGSVPVGRTFAVCRHHRIFRLMSLPSTTRQIFVVSPLPSWYQKISIRWNNRNHLLLWRRAVKKRAHFRDSGKSLTWAMREDPLSLVACGNLLSKASRNAAARLAGAFRQAGCCHSTLIEGGASIRTDREITAAARTRLPVASRGLRAQSVETCHDENEHFRSWQADGRIRPTR